jgi:hypothetical protein
VFRTFAAFSVEREALKARTFKAHQANSVRAKLRNVLSSTTRARFLLASGIVIDGPVGAAAGQAGTAVLYALRGARALCAKVGPRAVIRFVAASAGSEAVLGARLAEAEAVTWRAWVAPPAPEAAAEEEEAEEGAPAKPPPPPPELPTVHVPSVLREPRMAFLGVPRPGAYFAAPVVYGSPLHAECVPPPGGEEPAPEAEAAACSTPSKARPAPRERPPRPHPRRAPHACAPSRPGSGSRRGCPAAQLAGGRGRRSCPRGCSEGWISSSSIHPF